MDGVLQPYPNHAHILQIQTANLLSKLLVSGRPHMAALGRRGGILGHDAHQGMGCVGFLQPSTFLCRQDEIHRFGSPLDVV